MRDLGAVAAVATVADRVSGPGDTGLIAACAPARFAFVSGGGPAQPTSFSATARPWTVTSPP